MQQCTLLSLIGLLLYSFIGAGIFLALELPEQERRWARRRQRYFDERLHVVEDIVALINVTDVTVFLLPISVNASNETSAGEFIESVEFLLDRFHRRITELHHCERELAWDYWNSMLYCWTVVSTIGYGHIYPMTPAGKIATMIYALIGIPLMLMILTDLGRLLTRIMKLPWFVTKLVVRRMCRCCFRMSMEQIIRAEQRDRQGLEVFDLPIPVAMGIVVGWIFVCSAIQMIWEHQWDYLVAFYFFFISLTTIGLGDVVPDNPHYLLLTFGNILIGLSLLSMCINLIHSRIEQTYNSARRRRLNRQRTKKALKDPKLASAVTLFAPNLRPKTEDEGDKSKTKHLLRKSQTLPTRGDRGEGALVALARLANSAATASRTASRAQSSDATSAAEQGSPQSERPVTGAGPGLFRAAAKTKRESTTSEDELNTVIQRVTFDDAHSGELVVLDAAMPSERPEPTSSAKDASCAVEIITESMISAAGVVEPNSDVVDEEPTTGITLANDLPSGIEALRLLREDLFSDQRCDINRRRAGITRPHESFSRAIYSAQAEEQQALIDNIPTTPSKRGPKELLI